MGINIYVGNLAYEVTEADLEGLFGEHGRVDSVKIIMDRDTGRPKGFGFVEMSDQAEGEQAIQALNGKEIKNRPLKVSEARPKPDRPGAGGGRRGGGGGRGRSRDSRGENGGGGNYKPRY